MRRGESGLTLLEVTISAALLSGVMIGAQSLLQTSAKLTDSETRAGVAAERVGRATNLLADALRHGSLATTRHVDGTNFTDGTSDRGIQVKPVLAYRGIPILGADAASYHWDSAREELVRTVTGVDETLARGVTSFSVSRTGNLFTIEVTARCGPADDRGRTSHTRVELTARNP